MILEEKNKRMHLRWLELFLLIAIGGFLLWQWLSHHTRQTIHAQAKKIAILIVAVALILVIIRMFQAA